MAQRLCTQTIWGKAVHAGTTTPKIRQRLVVTDALKGACRYATVNSAFRECFSTRPGLPGTVNQDRKVLGHCMLCMLSARILSAACKKYRGLKTLQHCQHASISSTGGR